MFSHVWLFVTSGSSVHGTSQVRIVEWAAISYSRESSLPRDWNWVSCIAGRSYTYIYVYVFFFKYFSHLAYYRILSKIPCAIQ